ncbi:MAG: AMP-binding protein, partial [Deltaproteobacteria bacterium]|nr:AMP-binding protein [Deltaproteobacteria bacterium]
IIVRCGSVMLRYHEAPAETEEAIRDGWFYTGDFGKIDAAGYVHFCGLRKAITKVNGITKDLPPARPIALRPTVSEPLPERVDSEALHENPARFT